MKFLDAVYNCHVRSSIYRKSNPDKKYPKNHRYSLFARVPVSDQRTDDWEEYDPEDFEEHVVTHPITKNKFTVFPPLA